MINREATIRWKGYDPSTLKPNSNKKVWVICDKCGNGRWSRYDAYTNLCKTCAIPKGDNHYLFGKHLTKETKKKISIANVGQVAWNKGVSNNQMTGKNNPMHKPEVVAKTSGDNHWTRRIGISDETRVKMSLARVGKEPWNKGKTCPQLSEKQMGVKNHMFGKISPLRGIKRPDLTGENANAWKGGKKLKWARAHAKRKLLFGFNPLNKPHDRFEGHHIDYNNVIFIPEKLHHSVVHSVSQNRNMNIINNKVCDWYLKFQGVMI